MADYFSSYTDVGSRTKEALLAYYRKTGRVVSVRRGLYAVVPLGAKDASSSVDPYLVAAKLTKDAVLSYHTALSFHGHAYSVYEHFIYMASRPVSPVTFHTYVFRGTRFPEPLRRVKNENYGVVRLDRFGMEVNPIVA